MIFVFYKVDICGFMSRYYDYNNKVLFNDLKNNRPQ